MKQVRRILKLVAEICPSALWTLAFQSVLEALQPFVSIWFYSRILNSIQAGLFEQAWRQALIMILTITVLALAAKSAKNRWDATSQYLDDLLEVETLYKAYTMEYQELEKEETLQSIRRMKNAAISNGGINDFTQNAFLVLQYFLTMLISVFFAGGIILQMAASGAGRMSAILLGIMLAAYALAFWVSSRMNRKKGRLDVESRHRNEHANSASNYLFGSILDYRNGKDIRLSRMQKMLESEFNRFNDIFCPNYIRWGRKSGEYSALEIFVFVLAGGTAYLYVGQKALAGLLPVGSVLLYVNALGQLTDAVSRLVQKFSEVSYQSEYIRLYEEFIHHPNVHQLGTIPTEKRQDRKYVFTFEDVSFHYPDTAQDVLSHISLTIDASTQMAIVGRNGAGKSTLVKLLCRLYEPTGGRILLNGIDIAKYDYRDYVDLFSVVFQDFSLFAQPLDENIAGGGEPEDARTRQCLEEMGLGERFAREPRGIRSFLYRDIEEGIQVSGGEAQKIAIARALYKDAPFVILDEPTSALDPLSEAEIYDNFHRLVQNRSSIFISHRMSSCKFCREILVLDHGRIVQRGTHEQLLKEAGIYRQLWEAQARYYQKADGNSAGHPLNSAAE